MVLGGGRVGDSRSFGSCHRCGSGLGQAGPVLLLRCRWGRRGPGRFRAWFRRVCWCGPVAPGGWLAGVRAAAGLGGAAAGSGVRMSTAPVWVPAVRWGWWVVRPAAGVGCGMGGSRVPAGSRWGWWDGWGGSDGCSLVGWSGGVPAVALSPGTGGGGGAGVQVGRTAGVGSVGPVGPVVAAAPFCVDTGNSGGAGWGVVARASACCSAYGGAVGPAALGAFATALPRARFCRTGPACRGPGC